MAKRAERARFVFTALNGWTTTRNREVRGIRARLEGGAAAPAPSRRVTAFQPFPASIWRVPTAGDHITSGAHDGVAE